MPVDRLEVLVGLAAVAAEDRLEHRQRGPPTAAKLGVIEVGHRVAEAGHVAQGARRGQPVGLAVARGDDQVAVRPRGAPAGRRPRRRTAASSLSSTALRRGHVGASPGPRPRPRPSCVAVQGRHQVVAEQDREVVGHLDAELALEARRCPRRGPAPLLAEALAHRLDRPRHQLVAVGQAERDRARRSGSSSMPVTGWVAQPAAVGAGRPGRRPRRRPARRTGPPGSSVRSARPRRPARRRRRRHARLLAPSDFARRPPCRPRRPRRRHRQPPRRRRTARSRRGTPSSALRARSVGDRRRSRPAARSRRRRPSRPSARRRRSPGRRPPAAAGRPRALSSSVTCSATTAVGVGERRSWSSAGGYAATAEPLAQPGCDVGVEVDVGPAGLRRPPPRTATSRRSPSSGTLSRSAGNLRRNRKPSIFWPADGSRSKLDEPRTLRPAARRPAGRRRRTASRRA